jgi:hypothetical protein
VLAAYLSSIKSKLRSVTIDPAMERNCGRHSDDVLPFSDFWLAFAGIALWMKENF